MIYINMIDSPPPPADPLFRSIDDYLDSPDSADIRTGIMMKLWFLKQSPYNIKVTVDPFGDVDIVGEQIVFADGETWKEHVVLHALQLKRRVGILREWLHSEFDEHPELGLLSETVVEWRRSDSGK